MAASGTLLRNWKIDALIALGVAGLAAALFAGGALDLAAARLFYRAHSGDAWPLGGEMPWSLLYRMAPWITASLGGGGLAALFAGYWLRRGTLRRHATFVLFSLVIGPGLLVNGVFKDHWNRPRPRDVVEFGGAAHYTSAPLPGQGGKSFPCGHCSVGFLYGLGWWIWNGTRPLLAMASAGLGLAMGIALGVGRMAAGGHFISDIVWSALIPFFVAHLLYHYVLKIPFQERIAAPSRAVSPRQAMLWRALPIAAGLGALGVLAAVFLTAHGTPVNAQIAIGTLAQPPRVFELAARTANVDITLLDDPGDQVSVAGELHGFGLPTSRMSAGAVFEPAALPKLRYVVEQHGWFTDLDAALSVRLPPGPFQRVVVRLDHGNITVKDATRARVVQSGALQLDLRTEAGEVRVQRRPSISRCRLRGRSARLGPAAAARSMPLSRS